MRRAGVMLPPSATKACSLDGQVTICCGLI